MIEIWRVCLMLAWTDPKKDIARKLAVDPERFLVGEVEGTVVATCVVGYEGRRGWINSLAVLPEYQKHGYGRALVEEAERLLRAAGCPKVNLQVRTSNRKVIAFYEKLGFRREKLVNMGKRLAED